MTDPAQFYVLEDWIVQVDGCMFIKTLQYRVEAGITYVTYEHLDSVGEMKFYGDLEGTEFIPICPEREFGEGGSPIST